MEGTGIHADANGHPAVLGLASHELDFFGLAQVSGVEAKTVDPCFESRESHLDVKVDVRDDGNGRPRHHHGETFGGGVVVAGAAHDVRTGGGQGVNLLQGSFGIGSLRRRHGLDGNGGVAPHGNGTHGDLTSCATGSQEAGRDIHSPILPCQRADELLKGIGDGVSDVEIGRGEEQQGQRGDEDEDEGRQLAGVGAIGPAAARPNALVGRNSHVTAI